MSPYGQPAASPYGQTAYGQLASPFVWVGARIIDSVITWIVTFVIGMAALIGSLQSYDAGSGRGAGTSLMVGGSLLVVAFNALYYVLPVAIWGAAPGKAICGLRIVANDGRQSPAGWGRALGRFALPAGISLTQLAVGPIMGLVSLALVAISAVLLFVDDQHRTLEDRDAGTIVVTT